MVNAILQILTNRIAWAAFVGWLVAQLIKTLLLYRKSRHLKYSWFVKTGSMPSSHSSLMTATTLAILYTQGVTPLFIFAGVMSIAIIRLLPNKDLSGHTADQIFVGILLGILCSFVALL